MSNENWLLLTDYSSKYRISVSTLRRRIKADQIPFRFESGKYFIFDTPPEHAVEAHPKTGLNATPGHRPEFLASATTRGAVEEVPLKLVPVDLDIGRDPTLDFEAHAGGKDAPLISTATKLLNELKRAYMNILQEKEEQIIHLKEEVSDLKTLVRVLEGDNERLRAFLEFHSGR